MLAGFLKSSGKSVHDSSLAPHPAEFALAFTAPRVDAATEAPERVCPYCGHGIYAVPRAISARCHGCQRMLDVRPVDLHGEVTGAEFITAGTLRVHADARVSGRLIASRVIVEGRVLGIIAATHQCTIRAGGKVSGQIFCRRIAMDAGAEVSADIERIG